MKVNWLRRRRKAYKNTENSPLIRQTRETLEELLELAPRFENAFTAKKREVVMKAIEKKRAQELNIPQTQEIIAGWSIGLTSLDKLNAMIVDNKIRYTQRLFDLVHDDDIDAFFRDLVSGLDYVLSRWDLSESMAKDYNYMVKPTSVRRGPVLLLGKRLKDEGTPPEYEYRKVRKKDEETRG
jgi:hypothetical protein